MRDFWVYILRCSDASYYVGMTNDLDRRLLEHTTAFNEGSYTSDRRPVTLVYSTSFRDVGDAIYMETVVKAWSRKKKEALIAGDIQLLKELARKRFPERWRRKCAARTGLACRLVRFLIRSQLHSQLMGSFLVRS